MPDWMDGYGLPNRWNRKRDGFEYHGQEAPCYCGAPMNRIVHNDGRDWWFCTGCHAKVRLGREDLLKIKGPRQYEKLLSAKTLELYGQEFFGIRLEEAKSGDRQVDTLIRDGPPAWMRRERPDDVGGTSEEGGRGSVDSQPRSGESPGILG